MSNRASDILRQAADLFEERNAVYGDNYKMVGEVMKGLFPDGVILKTVNDWNRMHILLLDVVKTTRYTVNWETGHRPSIEDKTVYSAMLDMIDRDIADAKNSDPPFFTESNPEKETNWVKRRWFDK